MNVLIEIKNGIPTIVGGTLDLVVYFIDHDTQEEPDIYTGVVTEEMSEQQIEDYIKQLKDEQPN